MSRASSNDLLFIPEQKCGSFYLKPQYVSFKEHGGPWHQKLSAEDLRSFTSFCIQTQRPSKKDVKSLEHLKRAYPRVPEINNLLILFYLKLKKLKKAEALILETYETYPDNLLAKINYADHCLRKNRPDRVAFLFSNTFDLALLYPSREVFHVSEFRGFMTLMGFYHHSIQQKEHAICYHYLARRVDPRHPAVLLLGRTLYYTSLFKRLINVFKNRN